MKSYRDYVREERIREKANEVTEATWQGSREQMIQDYGAQDEVELNEKELSLLRGLLHDHLLRMENILTKEDEHFRRNLIDKLS